MSSPEPPKNPHASISTPVPFPCPDDLQTNSDGAATPSTKHRGRTGTNTSTASSRIRTASIKLMEANPPPGMWAATGSVASRAPSLADIRRGSFGSDGWDEQRQRLDRRSSQGSDRADRPANQRKGSSNNFSVMGTEPFPAVTEERPSFDAREQNGGHYGASEQNDGHLKASEHNDGHHKAREVGVGLEPKASRMTDGSVEGAALQPQHSEYANGYIPPPKLPWTRSFAIGLKGFWKWFLTIPGFLITVYALNVVAWGGMLFLLLCNAAPAMCTPTCDDISSPRRVWVEIDSQILNALFCVTGFGLAPWRFRDLYWWAHWRMGGSKHTQTGIRRLAGIHKGWFRLPGSQHLEEHVGATNASPEDPAVPIPAKSIPDPPPTGIRAPPTKSWKMDFVLWMNAANTFFQILLCFYMWHYDRIERPSWATGLFVAMGCGVAGAGGIMMWHEGKNIKKVEGVPMRKEHEGMSTDVEVNSAQNVPLVSRSETSTKS